MEAAAGLGLYTHFVGDPGFVRSSAKTLFGHGVTMYIVLLTTSGGASNPSVVPVENVEATWSLPTLAGVISFNAEKRVDA